MTKIVIEKLVWNEWNLEHIKKHGVSVKEITEAGKRSTYHKHTYNNRYIAFGRSGNRIIALVVKRQQAKTYYLVTARDADKKERRRLYEKEK